MKRVGIVGLGDMGLALAVGRFKELFGPSKPPTLGLSSRRD